MSLDANKDAMIKQANVIKEIANDGNCVIVGRAADYILRDNPNLVKIFLYAPLDYRINKIKEIYKDDDKTAKKYAVNSDKARANYYELISNQVWGNKENYDLCIDCRLGNDKVVSIICDYILSK